MMLMADDGVDFPSSGGEDLGFRGELEDEHLSIDMDSLMSILEESGDQQPGQMALVDCFAKDVLQGESTVDDSYLPGTSDQGQGSCVQITSPIHSCSGSLKDWIPSGPKYETSAGGVTRNGTANALHSGNSNHKVSGVSSENTSQNVAFSLQDISYIQDNQFQYVDSLPAYCTQFLPAQYNLNSDGSQFFDTSSPCFSDSFDFQSMPSDEDMMFAGGDENNIHVMNTEYGDSASRHSQMGRSEVCTVDSNGQDVKEENILFSMPFSNDSYANDGQTEQQSQFSTYPYMSSNQEGNYVFNNIEIPVDGYNSLSEMNRVDTGEAFQFNLDDRSSTNIDSKQQLLTGFNLAGKQTIENLGGIGRPAMSYIKIGNVQDSKSLTSSRNINGRSVGVSEIAASGAHKATAESKLPDHMKFQREGKNFMLNSAGHHSSQVFSESIQSTSTNMKYRVDDDNDVCIIEDISKPPRPHPLVVTTRYVNPTQRTADSIPHTGPGETRLKVNDERLIFRVALQDLSQPKTEADPPEGVLAVPLLRHQRIALSWMVNKETAGMTCSGGILADDQGLGKTISTIALILKERSPSSKPAQERSKLVTLNLDDDDDGIQELDGICAKGTSTLSKGRPSAGTLVVCPTSVLRQWADELRNKVTSEANLSVLVYHGGNRTKDPNELAKYDVVVTTYSIVSMEVPKQPLVDQDEDEENHEAKGYLSSEFSSSRKRKLSENSDKKPSKKGHDKALLESASRPLARVGWFRVVLDEAQSIKNHRTQVARACWGLRAKRRWCLSGTPIQNAIDDLYSYFRFLKYEPYSIYKSFCSSIKVPIQRSPAKGYKKLQAVLKTVMLRRTKGTILDGEPIINLPPKTIELRKVEFSKEERDFYSKLEADSRAQFAVYAAAGTVKQNYVNILLMLLRLRQACDHPYLVKKCAFSSVWRSSVDDAKKVPFEKRTSLVNCLEGSLALCGICNDVPEDAVISVCGHVFCNQCICEHLTGDDNQCPKAACKIRLSTSSVYSKETLVNSMLDQLAQVNSLDSPDAEPVQANEPTDPSYCSSKLKAAIEVLQSLPKYNVVSKCNSNTSSTEPSNFQEHRDGEGPKLDSTDQSAEEKDSSDVVKFVGEKAIVFSQWTRMLDLFESCLKNSNIEYRRLDGTMSVLARDKAVKDFNTIPEVTVMIMSLKAASLGLNMVAACHVMMLDLWWNPTTEDQAIDRAHRIGQTRPVKVLRLTVKDTVEDRILALQQKKREMVSSAFGEDEKGGRQSRLTVEDLRYLFMV
uniref:Helicase-like transcription factor CHR28 n=1 Tax=Kalanchoe fedtschenkoi TaxID=63787 RepID=A0A7N0TJC4_KALFE